MALIQHIVDSIHDDAPVRDVRICIHASIVESLRVGLCGHTQADQAYDVIKRQDVVANHGKLREFSAKDLSRYALSKLPIEASVGIAAINSILDVDWTKVHPESETEVVIDKSRGKRVVMVGHFTFAERVRKVASELVLVGLEPGEGQLSLSEAPKVLPKADVVIFSSNAIVNQSIEQHLNLTRNAAFVAIMGPSTIFSPIFFRYGVHALLGALIDDVETVIRHLSEGASLQHIPGLKQIAMYAKDYLGV